MMSTYIYGLVDPRDGYVRYVGRTIRHPDARLMSHTAAAKASAKMRPLVRNRKIGWILDVIRSGHELDVTILELVEDESQLAEREHYWINRLEGQPGGITNVSGTQDIKEYLRDYYTEKQPSDEPDMTPAELIDARINLGLTQAKLARSIGYHYSAVSLWESGKRPIPGRIRIALRGLTKP